MFGKRAATIRVTNRAELEAALHRAGRIVVDGDPALADWAVARLAGKPDVAGTDAVRLAAEDRTAHVAVRRRAPPLWPWIAGALLLAAGVGAAVLVENVATLPHFAAALRPGHAAPAPVAATDWTRLAWPAVALAAVLVLFFAVRRALDSGRDVAVSWQVTERFQGRVEFVRRAG